MSKDSPFPWVGIVGKVETLLEAAFAVRADEMRQACYNQLSQLGLFLGHSHPLMNRTKLRGAI